MRWSEQPESLRPKLRVDEHLTTADSWRASPSPARRSRPLPSDFAAEALGTDELP